MCPKGIVGSIKFGSSKIWARKKCWVRTDFRCKNIFEKNLWSKKYLVPKIFGSSKIACQKLLSQKKNLVKQKKFWVAKIKAPKNLTKIWSVTAEILLRSTYGGSKKKYGSEEILDPNKFLSPERILGPNKNFGLKRF